MDVIVPQMCHLRFLTYVVKINRLCGMQSVNSEVNEFCSQCIAQTFPDLSNKPKLCTALFLTPHIDGYKHRNLSWIKTDQLDVTWFIISLFTAQHVSNVSTSIFRSERLIVDLFHVLYCSGSMCVGVTVWFGWGGVVSLCRLKHYSANIRNMLSGK